jgi:phage baseplate assembly protein W
MAVQQTEIWSDLDHRLVADSLGNLKKVVNAASVMSSIDNILRTYQGERVMLPQFASNFRSMVFENMSPTLLKFLVNSITETLAVWDSRVSVVEVDVKSDPDESSVSLTVHFSIKGQENIYRYETKFKKG